MDEGVTINAAAAAGPGLLERSDELERIGGLLDAAAEGEGSVVLVEGAPGIGKTALLRATREAARDRGLLTPSAIGSELERGFAFGLVRQVLEPIVAAADPAERAALLSGAAALAGPVIGTGAAAAAPTVDASFSVLHGLGWLCTNLAVRTPLLVTIDDVHWGDRPSLRFLEFLSRRLEGVPLMLVLAARPGEAGDAQDLLDAMAHGPAARVLRPAALGEAAVAELTASALGERPDPAFVSACATATGGNPFLLRALLRHLAENDTAPTATAGAEVGEVAPVTVARAAHRHVRRLGPAAEALARAVAVLGDRSSLRNAAALAGLEIDIARRAADALAAAGVLALPPPRFVHPIVREAIHDDIPTAERAAAHASAAKLLVADRARVEEIALHLLHTDPAGDPWVVRGLRETAAAALAEGAPEIAVGHLRRALEEPPPPEDRDAVRLDLGLAEARAGDAAAIDRLAAVTATATDPGVATSAAIARSRVLVLIGRSQAATEGLVAIRDQAERIGPELGRLVDSEIVDAARLHLEQLPVLRRHLERLDATTPADDPRRAVVEANLAFDRVAAGAPADGVLAALAPHVTGGGLLQAAGADAPGHYLGVNACVLLERPDLARPALEASLADARARGSLFAFAYGTRYRSVIECRFGRVDQAAEDAGTALRLLTERGWQAGAPGTLAFLLEALVEQGELAAATEALRPWSGETFAGSPFEALFLGARGRLRAAAGETAAGLSDLLRCGEVMEAWGWSGATVVPWRSRAALARAALGDREAALALADEELRLARASGLERVTGIALRAAGVVRGGSEGVELLRTAVDVLAPTPARLEHARALVDLGAAILATGDAAGARVPLREGMDGAHRVGARRLASRARTILLEAGARPRRAVVRGVDALTPSQRRVAELAASGLSNRDIAETLFVTHKTVEVHLSQSYQKLGIRSRSQLGDALSAAG